MKMFKLRTALAKIVIARKWQQQLRLGVILVLVGAALFLPFRTTPNPSEAGTAGATSQDQLQAQVDTETGAPRDGRDPASQQQTSLASAASSPTVAGQRTDKPAAGVVGDQNHKHTHSDVYSDPNQTGIGSNGCYVDYGIPGEQCVPAHAATNGVLTCEGVRSHGFPDGVKVSGTDRFHLDTNHDGVACSAAD